MVLTSKGGELLQNQEMRYSLVRDMPPAVEEARNERRSHRTKKYRDELSQHEEKRLIEARLSPPDLEVSTSVTHGTNHISCPIRTTSSSIGRLTLTSNMGHSRFAKGEHCEEHIYWDESYLCEGRFGRNTKGSLDVVPPLESQIRGRQEQNSKAISSYIEVAQRVELKNAKHACQAIQQKNNKKGPRTQSLPHARMCKCNQNGGIMFWRPTPSKPNKQQKCKKEKRPEPKTPSRVATLIQVRVPSHAVSLS